MGAPWAYYFRMRIPGSKFQLDPGSKLIFAKYACRKKLLCQLKKKKLVNGRSKKNMGGPWAPRP